MHNIKLIKSKGSDKGCLVLVLGHYRQLPVASGRMSQSCDEFGFQNRDHEFIHMGHWNQIGYASTPCH